MKTFKRTIEEPILKIKNDECPSNPREWSNLGYFIVISSRYCSPDENVFLIDTIKNTGEDAEVEKQIAGRW
jgi:hypothetical protein